METNPAQTSLEPTPHKPSLGLRVYSRVFILGPLVLLGLVGVVCGPSVAWHDWKLFSLNWAFHDVVHPADSTLLTEKTDFGILRGNGNHCDYFVGQLRRSRRSKAEIEAAYEGIAVAARHFDHALPVSIVFTDNPNSSWTLPGGLLAISSRDDHLSNADATQTYVVYVLDVQRADGNDIRCH